MQKKGLEEEKLYIVSRDQYDSQLFQEADTNGHMSHVLRMI
jgi:hypothetical protein